MDAIRLDHLLRALSDATSRRGLTRALAGSALAGALSPLLGLAEVGAKNKHKKKKRRRKKKRRQKNQPFCAGKNICTDESANCGSEPLGPCNCYVTSDGAPFCGTGLLIVDTCAECSDEETCIDNSSCGGGAACTTGCPNPL